MKPDEAPVLVEMNGVSYRVYEIDEKPYTGKIMEYHASGIEKKEIVYTDGVLARNTEWHENGNKKMEVKIGADGARQETYWDESGNEQRQPASTAQALGRKMNWTLSVNARSIDIAYRGKSSEVIRKGFGEPDEKQNGVWVYRGMKVQTAQGLMTTVRFAMQNDLVFRVSVEP
jgi:antitoxin component YwqK of YwqJK toxin-antitoxin module